MRTNAAQLQASDFGVVFGVMMLEMEMEQSNYLSDMLAKLCKLSGTKAKPVNCASLDFSYSEIIAHLRSNDVDVDTAIKISNISPKKDQPLLQHKLMVILYSLCVS